ncbi:MAG TPA: flagellar hook-basal body complex protein FliE [Firmicutes bacterium]|nr:flagellar hook-basal body complex protein FliE [Bacillota bacterium]
MSISNVLASHQLVTQQVQSQQSLISKNQDTEKATFSDIFSQALNKTNEMQYAADVETEKFIVGESEDIHGMLIAMEEAKIALEFTTQVRNKVIDAYSEIKNMQI